MNKVNGLLYGLLSSASFGLIPLFTIPAMQAGMQFESILFYRFLFACLALGGILLVNGQSFRIKRQDIPSLFLLALLYLMSAVFLFWGYKFMASGVATTIHFMYPVLTTLIMMPFLKKRSPAGGSLPLHPQWQEFISYPAEIQKRGAFLSWDFSLFFCRHSDMRFISSQ